MKFIDEKTRSRLYSEKKVYAILAVLGYFCICLALRSRNADTIGSSFIPVVVLAIALYRLFR
ncbi:MAG: hypothetical protein EOO01_09695 [Chitinophagaceae bacterium]|nr:MAG: hypothetical protein EOO01_09695 [Chitinophagaceae bacterium]